MSQKLLRISLLSFIILLLSLIVLKSSTRTSFAMNSKALETLVPLDTPTVVVTQPPVPTPTPVPPPPTPTPTPVPPPPTSTPTPVPPPQPTPAPIATQPPKATPMYKPHPQPTRPVFLMPTATEVPTSVAPTPTMTPIAVTPSATVSATATSASLSLPLSNAHAQLSDAADPSAQSFLMSLLLGIGAPLLLIGAGGAWLLIRWQMKRRKIALENAPQANPWMKNHPGQQASFHGQQTVSATAFPPSPNGVAGPPLSSSYAAGDPQAFAPQMFSVPANEPAGYPIQNMPMPRQMGFTEAPPIRSDPTLESTMRQAQTGLFVLLGRENGIG